MHGVSCGSSSRYGAGPLSPSWRGVGPPKGMSVLRPVFGRLMSKGFHSLPAVIPRKKRGQKFGVFERPGQPSGGGYSCSDAVERVAPSNATSTRRAAGDTQQWRRRCERSTAQSQGHHSANFLHGLSSYTHSLRYWQAKSDR